MKTIEQIKAGKIVIPVKSFYWSQEGQCMKCAEKAVELFGGSIVYGWQLLEHPHLWQLIHHAVWSDESCELFDVSSTEDEISFLRDDEATPTLKWKEHTEGEITYLEPKAWSPRRNQYIPKTPQAAIVCEYLERSDTALQETANLRAANYWTVKAEKASARIGYVMPTIRFTESQVERYREYNERVGDVPTLAV